MISEKYAGVAIVTLAFAIVVFGMSLVVSWLRVKTNTMAPAVSGNPLFERAFRGHANTVEWTPISLPALWLFAIYCSGLWAVILGSLWIVGRIIYFAGYIKQAESRFIGMSVQSALAFVIVFGALGKNHLSVSSRIGWLPRRNGSFLRGRR